MSKYFIVEAKCGHVGRSNCIIISFPIIAETKKEAAQKARFIPRVKHDHKDAILSVVEVSKEEYWKQVEANNTDPYLLCQSRSEQDSYDLSDRVIKDDYYDDIVKKTSTEACDMDKKKVRNPKRYMKNKGYCNKKMYLDLVDEYLSQTETKDDDEDDEKEVYVENSNVGNYVFQNLLKGF